MRSLVMPLEILQAVLPNDVQLLIKKAPEV